MAPESDREPLINDNPQIQSYYHSLESRIGYRLLLNGARHFGFYENDTWWPFPLSKALRAMEDKLAEALNLPAGSYVLDAGCGVGRVAIHLATKHGLRVEGIDIVEHHLHKARRHIAQSGLPSRQVSVRRMDYHHLESFEAETFDGIYTMETFSHATDAEAVLAGFFRVLQPGGRLSIFDYDHELGEGSSGEMADSMRKINEYSAMPMNGLSQPGVFQRMLEGAGFTNVVVRDYSDNIKPMTRLFFLIAYVPFLIVTFFGLERYFINTIAGVQSYRGRKHWRYLAISATKPGALVETAKDR
ncbi:class I SAM-dependent methyltransferase [Aspergillus undulatus]|uniref:class I SAM-dependent methyltransferase n=1 Tax=Aspergillus undulatus TaxID=1810928 RepID=UPI003CCCA811